MYLFVCFLFPGNNLLQPFSFFFLCLSFYLSIHSFIHLFVCLFIDLFVCSFLYLFIYVSLFVSFFIWSLMFLFVSFLSPIKNFCSLFSLLVCSFIYLLICLLFFFNFYWDLYFCVTNDCDSCVFLFQFYVEISLFYW